MKKKILILMTIIWIMFIFFNSSQTAQVSGVRSGRIVSIIYDLFSWIGFDIEIGNLSIWIRKLAHVFEYLLLGILVTIIVFDMNLKISYKYIYSFTIPLLVAIVDETIQTVIPGRSGNVLDVLIDSIGIIIGLIITVTIKTRRYKKIK